MGRDASRAFLDLCFTPDCLQKASDLSGNFNTNQIYNFSDLSENQLKTIYEWKQFYFNEYKYPFIGTVIKN